MPPARRIQHVQRWLPTSVCSFPACMSMNSRITPIFSDWIRSVCVTATAQSGEIFAGVLCKCVLGEAVPHSQYCQSTSVEARRILVVVQPHCKSAVIEMNDDVGAGAG